MDAGALPKPKPIRMRGRSYVAFVFYPVVPIMDWLEEVDATLRQSPGFFAGKPVVLDLSAVDLSENAIAQLVANFEQRNLRILGIEGVDAARLTPSLPPLLNGGRHCVIGRCAEEAGAETQTGLAVARQPGAFRSVGSLSRRRHHGGGIGQFRRRNCCWRLHPRLRHAARPRDGRHQR